MQHAEIVTVTEESEERDLSECTVCRLLLIKDLRALDFCLASLI